MNYRVWHQTRLTYAAPIAHAEFNLRLAPIDWPGQSLRDFSLTFTPQPRTQRDLAGPYPARTRAISFTQPVSAIEVTSSFAVSVERSAPVGSGPVVHLLRDEALASSDMSNRSPVPYLYPSRIAVDSPDIADWAAAILSCEGGIVDAVRGLNSAIHREFTYQPGSTNSATPPLRAFAERKGVCQDFAHVMIVGLRALGIPAAYVSGYLRTLPPPGEEKLIGADAMHAWVAVWCGAELGWIGFDPTNDALALDDHIVVAMGRDYADVAPIDGVFVGAAPQAMSVAVDVSEI